jgi:hypothetical protein
MSLIKRAINVETNIPDLSGKVILVTGVGSVGLSLKNLKT